MSPLFPEPRRAFLCLPFGYSLSVVNVLYLTLIIHDNYDNVKCFHEIGRNWPVFTCFSGYSGLIFGLENRYVAHENRRKHLDNTKSPWYNGAMDETKTNPDWKPETWGGPRPGSGRPTLGGDEDPTVKVTVAMPLSLKLEAIRLGDGCLSRGIREAIAIVTMFNYGS